MLELKHYNSIKTFLIVLILAQLVIIEAAYSKDKNANTGRSSSSSAMTTDRTPAKSSVQSVSPGLSSRPDTARSSVNTTRSSINASEHQTSNITRNSTPSVTRNSVTFSTRSTPGISQQSSSHKVNVHSSNTIQVSTSKPSVSTTPDSGIRNNVTTHNVTSTNRVITVKRSDTTSVNMGKEGTRVEIGQTNRAPLNINTNAGNAQRTVTVSRAIEKSHIIGSPVDKERISSERKTNTSGSNQSPGSRGSELSQARADFGERSRTEQRANVNEKVSSVRESIKQRQQEIQQKPDENLDKIRQKIGQTSQAKLARSEGSKSVSISDRINEIRQNIRERQAELKEKRPVNLDRIRQRIDEGRSSTATQSAVREPVTSKAVSSNPASNRLNQLRQRISDKQAQLRRQRDENLSKLRERPQQNAENLRDRISDRQTGLKARQAGNIERIQKRADGIRERNWKINRQNLRYPHDRHSRKVVYYDFPHHYWYRPHNEYWYFDPYDNFCYTDIQPGFNFWVGYSFGNCRSFGYVHPYYHRKYVFVSLGGYWPYDYCYARYYWYGWHPYRWYGYYPVAREVVGDTYNYYTYNYYNTDNVSDDQTSGEQIPSVDENTFADVRAKLAQQAAAEPQQPTVADTYFEEAVKAFEVGAYGVAADKLGKAMELAPEDEVLPFAYAQALIAVENYIDAAKVLRESLVKVDPEKEGVFFPRGLYPSDDALFEQIDRLAAKAKMYPFDGDLQLLLGYQLLGIGESEEAFEALQKAAQDLQNADAAVVLLEVLDRINTLDIQESDTIEKQPTSDGG